MTIRNAKLFFPHVRVLLTVFLAVVSVGLAACGAAWRVKQKAEGYELPKRVTLYVVMSPAVAQGDSGLAAAVVDSLMSDLTKRGYDVPIEVAKFGEKPPQPRIELQIVSSEGGNTEMRGAGQFAGVLPIPGSAAVGAGAGIAGSSSITVDCYVVSAAGKSMFQGRISALTLGNTTGYDAVEAGESVGLKIASTLAK